MIVILQIVPSPIPMILTKMRFWQFNLKTDMKSWYQLYFPPKFEFLKFVFCLNDTIKMISFKFNLAWYGMKYWGLPTTITIGHKTNNFVWCYCKQCEFRMLFFEADFFKQLFFEVDFFKHFTTNTSPNKITDMYLLPHCFSVKS